MEVMSTKNLQKTGFVLLYSFIAAFIFLTLCSRSSFLYPCNNWDDANSYFTMGKFMMNGGVIYRDLYDQKGPYLYLLYGIAYLLKNDSFAGVFVLEVISLTAYLLAGCRIACLYCKKETAMVLLPVMAFAVTASKSFYWGGAAEEFCLPLLAWSLYASLRYFKEEYPKAPSARMLLIHGIFAGIIMLVKYTMLGFYFAWMGAIALLLLFHTGGKRKNIAGSRENTAAGQSNIAGGQSNNTAGQKGDGLGTEFAGRLWVSMKCCLLFLAGMGLAVLPWLLYFGWHGALDDWYQCYVYNNVFLYSDLGEETVSLGSKVYTLAKILYYLILDNYMYMGPIIIGFVLTLASARQRWYEKVNLYGMFGFLFLGIFIGGANLFYYSIPLMIFSLQGLGIFGMMWDGIRTEYTRAIGLIVLAGSVAAASSLSMNTEFMQQDKESFFLYQFKEVVEQEESPTLLNYNCLDAGLYTVADILPTCKYFQTNGIALDEMNEEQSNYIKEGKTEFILARGGYPESIWEHYELAAKASNRSNDTEFIYFLFQRK